MGKYLVGIDLGTTGAKTCVFDLDGNQVGVNYREYSLFCRGEFLEQSGPEITEVLFATCKSAIENAGIDPQDISGVCVSTQTAVGIYLDENHEPLRDFISWQDFRGKYHVPEYLSKVAPEQFYLLTGHPVMFSAVASKALWVQHNQPELWKKVRYICTPQDYILYQLGADECLVDVSSAGRNIWMNTMTNTYAPELLNALNIKEEMLPKICAEAGKVVGHIKEDVAKRTGLPVGCPICLGAHDQDCCTLGAGGYKGGIAIMTIGTLLTCSVISDKPFRSKDGSLICNSKQGTGNWVTEITGESTATSFKWLRDTLGKLERDTAKAEGKNPFDYLTGLIGDPKPGANGVTFFAGLRNGTGTIAGISLDTSLADIVQALLEGISYEMKKALELVSSETQSEISEISLAGGIINSPVWCQILSDVLQCRIRINDSKEVGCLGAAMFAGVGTGIFANCQEAVEKMAHFGKTYEPNPEKKEGYEAGYQLWLDVSAKHRKAMTM